tara:strand:- start:424 stop:774 length:351 start_codon:yes stop_codon:yes gene_type:complete
MKTKLITSLQDYFNSLMISGIETPAVSKRIDEILEHGPTLEAHKLADKLYDVLIEIDYLTEFITLVSMAASLMNEDIKGPASISKVLENKLGIIAYGTEDIETTIQDITGELYPDT